MATNINGVYGQGSQMNAYNQIVGSGTIPGSENDYIEYDNQMMDSLRRAEAINRLEIEALNKIESTLKLQELIQDDLTKLLREALNTKQILDLLVVQINELSNRKDKLLETKVEMEDKLADYLEKLKLFDTNGLRRKTEKFPEERSIKL